MSNQVSVILVFGLPRSGTTWLGKLFDSHPQTMYRHEPDYFPHLKSVPRFPVGENNSSHKEFLQCFASDLPGRNEPSVVGKLPVFRKSWQKPADHYLFKTSLLLNKLGERVKCQLPVISSFSSPDPSGYTVVWKSIESMGRFGLVVNSLENAKAIHLIRHPCGSINSRNRGVKTGAMRAASGKRLRSLYGPLLKTPQARKYDLSLNYLQSLTDVQRMAWRWVLVHEKALDDTKDNNRVRVVRYEDICAQPEQQVRSLFSFCGLGWNEQTESFVGKSTNTSTTAYYGVYKQSSQSMSRWRDELSAEDINQITAILHKSRLAEWYPENGNMEL